jgi:hypothetical protein
MKRCCTIVAIGIAFFAVSRASEAGQPSGTAPTFTKDVAPILYNKCATCHRPGEVAPMSLLTYQDVRPWAKSIKAKVVSREMPPWHADPRYSSFRNDRRLTTAEIETVTKWADAGAPAGNAADLPPVPKFASGWQGGEPDYVFEMPDYEVPAEGELPALYFWVKNPFTEDKFVEAIEMVPGDRNVVHHGRIDVVKLPEGHTVVNGILIGPDGKPAAEGGGGVQDSPHESGQRFHLISFTPGRGLERFRPGTGKRISAGQWIRFNLHYQPSGVRAVDRSKLGIWFSKVPVTHEVFTRTVGQSLPTDTTETPLIVEGTEIMRSAAQAAEEGEVFVAREGAARPRGAIPSIPPYAENWEIVGFTAITEPITLYSIWPHMHLRGKDMSIMATWPDGRQETIFSVPKYDFNWQLQYDLERPLKMPAGSKLTSVAHYDNSPANRYNPGPNLEVYWSEQSWDEMFSPFIEYSVDSLDLSAAGKKAEPQKER